MAAFVDQWSITDAGEVRTDKAGTKTAYYRLIAKMGGSTHDEALDASETTLRIGLAQFQRFQPHPNFALYGTEGDLYVSEFQAVQKPHTVYWNIQVTYTNEIVQDPRNLPAVIGEIQTYTMPGATLVDYNGDAILNTAGEPPEPFDFPERVMQIPIIKNIDAAVPAWLWDFEDCVNADTFLLGGVDGVESAPKTLLISSVKVSAIQEQGTIKYRTCTIEILRRKSTWEQVFPSRGFNQRVTEKRLLSTPSSGSIGWVTGQVLKPILIKNEPATEAQFLDSDGKWLEHPAPGDVVLLKALLQKPVPFSDFPLI